MVLYFADWLLDCYDSIGHAPGYPPGDLTMQGNFASWIDRKFYPANYIWVFMILKDYFPLFLQFAPDCLAYLQVYLLKHQH